MQVTTHTPDPDTRIERVMRAVEVIEGARAKIPRLSIRKAAERAGISDSTWRIAVQRERSVSGVMVPNRTTDDTLMAMARAVNVGRDVATILGLEDHLPSPADNPYTDPVERQIWELTDLSPERRRELIAFYRVRSQQDQAPDAGQRQTG